MFLPLTSSSSSSLLLPPHKQKSATKPFHFKNPIHALITQVPKKSQFKFTNEGSLRASQVEYNGNYSEIYPFSVYPFQLCFFNTTPNPYTLAIGMGSTTGLANLLLYRWVWKANRNHPIKENTTLEFGGDRNLILTDADGTIAWETNTANKGGVRLKLMKNGNLVILNSKGKFIWESFDYPSDSLLVGQSLKVGSKLGSAINGAAHSFFFPSPMD